MPIPALAGLCAGYAGAAYVLDVLVRPKLVAEEAIKYARSRGLPVISIGCGTPGSSLRTAIFGPLYGDISIDLAAPKDAQCGPNKVCWGDATDLSRWPDKYFGSVIASHVVEHLPGWSGSGGVLTAMQEMQRVAERVYIIVPSRFAPHSLLYPDHKWQIEDRTACALFWNDKYPVWTYFQLPYSIDNARRGIFT